MAYRNEPSSSAVMVQPPRHPVPQLQGPFEESMFESVHDDADMDVFLDPIARRNTLLEAPVYTRVVAGRWKQKPGEKYHPLWKLVAQISFGIHLLAEGIARSEDDVMQILQAHVDEIDGFLERTTEDFTLAKEDIEERLRCLALPLSHPATFDKMLEDRDFRLSIVEGNEKIEHIVDRTSQAMKDCLKDVQKGFDSSSSLEKYLHGLAKTWHRETIEHEAVFVAMLGNVEGWRKAFMDLHMQGSKLGLSIRKLTEIINQMQARAGEVSRRMLHQARGYSNAQHSNTTHQQAMGRPSGRGTPVSRYQAQPLGKHLPHQPGSQNLHNGHSNNGMRNGRSSHGPSLPGSRSTTPLDQLPVPQSINATANPLLVRVPADGSARVQSMVPSLLELPSAPLEQVVKPTAQQTSIKSFAAVELPADVPEETLRALPMSKQNRLSMGLTLLPGNKEKRLSKLQSPTTTLVDLLRTGPSNNKGQGNSSTPKSSRSPFSSRRGSVQRASVTVEDKTQSESNPPKTKPAKLSSAGSSISITSGYTKNNVRRPKKGVQHWFDALDDDSEDEKFSIQENTSPQISTTHLVAPPAKPVSEQGSHPGTPSWAVNTFEKAEQRRAQLRQGAFNSHPPNLPPGSPPMNNSPQMPNLGAGFPPRSSSASPTMKTLGEPGPEVSTTTSRSSSAHLQPHSDTQTSKGASAIAPEVEMERQSTVVAPTAKVFAVELEGSIPLSWNNTSKMSSSNPMIMELEAPRQYFKLPPRQITPNSTDQVNDISKRSDQPISELSSDSREAEKKAELATGDTEGAVTQDASDEQMTKPSVQEGTDSIDEWDVVGDYVDSETVGSVVTDEKNSVMPQLPSSSISQVSTPQTTQQPMSTSNQDFSARETRSGSLERTVATPQIPLPPSPIEVETEVQPVDNTSSQEQLFLLPAVAYKAPERSPKLRFESAQTLVENVSHTPTDSLVNDRKSTSSISSAVLEPSAKITRLDTSCSATSQPKEGSPKKVEHNTRDEAQPAEKRSSLDDKRSSSGHDNTNQWKAFFRGEASPISSNLSIRNIKRTSLDQKSPIEAKSPTETVLSQTNGSRGSGGPMMTSGGKDVLWFNKAASAGDNTANPSSKGDAVGSSGLGILTA